ncbi:MAG: hypothetical protein E4H27_06835, partial [Anaerolineales bacterium]
MSFIKAALILLITAVLVPVVGASSTYPPAQITSMTSATANPYLGGDIIISALDNQQYLPAVAYNSNHDEYLVVWYNQWAGNADIYAQRISAKGKLLSWFNITPTAPTTPYLNDRMAPSVAYDPDNDRYLVVWLYDIFNDGSDWDVHGVFVNWNGSYQSPWPFIICNLSTQQDMPKVAYSPVEKEFMIVWMTAHPSLPAYISGRRMNAATGVLSASDSDFTISHATQARVRPEIAYNFSRNEYLVVYDNLQDIYATRLTGKGAVLGGGEFPVAAWPGDETQPSVAYCRQDDLYLVAWQNPQPDIYARFVTANGAVSAEVLHLDYTGVAEISPSVACTAGGALFLVTWQQQFSSLSGPFGIWGQFVNANKTLGEPFGIMAPQSGVSAQFTSPVVTGG